MLKMDSWTSWLANGGQRLLEAALVEWLPRQRWFGAKARTIDSARVVRWADVPLGPHDVPALMLHVAVRYGGGDCDVYQVPVALSTGGDAEKTVAGMPEAVLLRLEAARDVTVLHEATVREDVRQALLGLIARNVTLPMHRAEAVALHAGRIEARAFSTLAATAQEASRIGASEQSNTSVLYGDKLILKFFRRLEPGENPDVELGRFLWEMTKFPRVAPLLGTMTMTADDGERTTLAMLQGFVPNEGDGWSWFLAQTGAFFAAVDAAHAEASDTWPNTVRATAETALEAAALLGQRTAEMHLALSTPTEDAAFSAEAETCARLEEGARRIDAQLAVACDLLQANLAELSEAISKAANRFLARRDALTERIHAIAALPAAGQRIRIHGDYHLGQILRTCEAPAGDFMLIDFEGEPARSLAERRSKQSPLKDVAGMVRSFAYAAFAGLDAFLKTGSTGSDGREKLTAWAAQWETAATAEFLAQYRETIAANPALLPPVAQADVLLRAFVLEKALYEVVYELNHRPDWLHIPMNDILRQ
jgi:maltose alpha-D-glucosyltransferase / alpha-amylase